MSHHHQPALSASCSCCCNCGCGFGYAPYPAPPAPVSPTDHLVHAIAAHLLLNTSPPLPPQPQPQQPQPPPHHTNLYSYHGLKPQPQHNPADHGHSHLLLHSLLRRVAALESSLPEYSPSSPVPLRARDDHRKPPSPRARRVPSARELAARMIQAHFRRFLARRSRTLRQLKHLAVLRSQSAALRASASGRHGDPAAVSEASMRLLLQLDTIQGGDPMIREGKRTVSRELTRILEFVDKVLVKEHEEMAMGGLEIREDHEGCNAGVMANPHKKKVSFNGHGKVYELSGEAEEGDDGENSSENSSSVENDERKGGYGKKGANGLGLAAPMPVHMESRRSVGEHR